MYQLTFVDIQDIDGCWARLSHDQPPSPPSSSPYGTPRGPAICVAAGQLPVRGLSRSTQRGSTDRVWSQGMRRVCESAADQSPGRGHMSG